MAVAKRAPWLRETPVGFAVRGNSCRAKNGAGNIR